MVKNFFVPLGIVLVFFVVGIVFSSYDNAEEYRPVKNSFEEKYGIFPVPVPEEVYFAGERIPLENFDIHESYDKELLINTYWQSQTVMFIKKANRYFPIIEPILKEHGIPEDFKFLAVAESGLSNVTSPAGAKGYWQILKGTGRELGLEINTQVDERLSIEKATVAACKYLKKSYKKYGSWAMAAASYNAGRRNISKQVQRQKTDYYFDLVLGEETGRYVYRIAALKTILENPEKYGFWVKKEDMYPIIPVKKITVDTTINNLPDFAHHLNINYKVLKALNPWLRESYLPNSSRKEYTIHIPEKGFRSIRPNLHFYPEDSVYLPN
jgi:hypothetical protein